MKSSVKPAVPSASRLSTVSSAHKVSRSKSVHHTKWPLQDFLQADKTKLLSFYAQYGIPDPVRGQQPTLHEAQRTYLELWGVDPNLDLADLGNLLAAKQLSAPSQESLPQQEGTVNSKPTAAGEREARCALPGVQEMRSVLQAELAELKKQHALLLQEVSKNSKYLEQLKETSSTQRQGACSAPAQADRADTNPPPPTLQLRLTNLTEKKEEGSAELLQQVAELLGSLPRVVKPVAASRQGDSTNRERAPRPVHITFASSADRETVLRCKAALSRNPETKMFSINEVLTREEQAHKQVAPPSHDIFPSADHATIVQPGPVSGLAPSPQLPANFAPLPHCFTASIAESFSPAPAPVLAPMHATPVLYQNLQTPAAPQHHQPAPAPVHPFVHQHQPPPSPHPQCHPATPSHWDAPQRHFPHPPQMPQVRPLQMQPQYSHLQQQTPYQPHTLPQPPPHPQPPQRLYPNPLFRPPAHPRQPAMHQ